MHRTVGSGGQEENIHACGYVRYSPCLDSATVSITGPTLKTLGRYERNEADGATYAGPDGDGRQEDTRRNLRGAVSSQPMLRTESRSAPSCQRSMR